MTNGPEQNPSTDRYDWWLFSDAYGHMHCVRADTLNEAKSQLRAAILESRLATGLSASAAKRATVSYQIRFLAGPVLKSEMEHAHEQWPSDIEPVAKLARRTGREPVTWKRVGRIPPVLDDPAPDQGSAVDADLPQRLRVYLVVTDQAAPVVQCGEGDCMATVVTDAVALPNALALGMDQVVLLANQRWPGCMDQVGGNRFVVTAYPGESATPNRATARVVAEPRTDPSGAPDS